MTRYMALLKEIRDGIREEIGKVRSPLRQAKLPPPIPPWSMGYNIRWAGEEARYVPYVMAQVGHRNRGEIGLDSTGNLVFHLRPDYLDVQTQLGLREVEEIWIVLKSPKEIVDAY